MEGNRRMQAGVTKDTTAARAITHQIVELATDIGRLRRRANGDEYTTHLVDRVGCRVHTIDALLWPTAGELFRHGDTVAAALAACDARARQLAALLGETAR